MIWRRVVILVLLLFVTGLVSSTVREIVQSMASTHQGTHAEGSPCPDPVHDGHPCGPGCACSCCPGHAAAVAVVVPRIAFGTPPSGEVEVQSLDRLHPRDFLRGIFRPPRA